MNILCTFRISVSWVWYTFSVEERRKDLIELSLMKMADTAFMQSEDLPKTAGQGTLWNTLRNITSDPKRSLRSMGLKKKSLGQ